MPQEKPKLEILIMASAKQLVTQYKGEQLHWQYSVWGKLNLDPTDRVFGLTNDYLATLPEATLDKLWNCYKDAHGVLFGVGQPDVIENDLVKIIDEMAECFDWEDVYHKTTTLLGVQPDMTIDDRNDGRNLDSTTISRQEALEMTVYCSIVKLITPIWGPHINRVKESATNYHKERIAARIFTRSKFTEMPPFGRIEEWISSLCAIRTPSSNTGITHGIARINLDSWCIGLVLTRRLAIYPTRSNNAPSIVTYVYCFMDDKFKNLKTTAYRDDKFPTNQNGGEEADGHADQYRIAQDVSDMTPTVIEYYLSHFDLIGQQLGLTEEQTAKVKELHAALMQHDSFKIEGRVHLVVPALIMRRLISPAMHRHLSRESRLAVIAFTAVKAFALGYEDIYSLLTSVRVPADIHRMELTTQNGRRLKKLTKEMEEQLIERYPYRTKAQENAKTCPAKIAIDELAKEISTYDWVGLDDISDIGNSIAKLFLQK